MSPLGRPWIGMLGAAICAVALACGGGDAPRRSPRSAVTILYDDPGDEFFLNPNRWDLAQFPVFLTLTTDELDEAGPQPRLARRWEHSPDYREWTIHLRPDVKWHDGVPVTAHDVKFTMDLWAHPDVLYPAGSGSSATVLDDSTLRITYRQPSREPLEGWNVYYPKHLLENLDPKEFASWEFWKHPVGNGAYRVVRHVSRTLMELEANPDYCCGKPRIERVVLKFAGGAPLTELLSGNVDVAQVSPAELPAALAADPSFEAHYYGTGRVTVHLFWNHRNALFEQADVRRALTLAIDRRELHRVLNLPESLPITDGIHNMHRYRRGEIAPALPYDPEAAGRLLDRAGWRAGSRGGPRERNGRGFRFTAIVPDAPWLASPIRAATFIQDQLRRIGIRMEIAQLESTDVVERIADGAFEAAITFLVKHPLRHAAYFGEGSPIGYAPPRVTELLRAAEVAMDLDEQDRIYGELAEIFHADVPVTFLYPNVENWVVHRRIRGLGSPGTAHPVMFMGDLWIEDEP